MDEGDWRGLVDINATVIVPGTNKSIVVSGNYDYGWEDGVLVGANRVGGAQWYGFAGYVKYIFANCPVMSKTPLLSKSHLGFRGEWFDDADGARTGVDLDTGGANFMGLTTTFGYRPWDTVLVRVEHRYDKADENVFEERGTVDANHQNTFAVDVIVSY